MIKGKPKGLRKLFWAVWGAWFNYKLKTKFRQLEKKGHFNPSMVEQMTTKMFNEEAQELYDQKAISDNQVYWNGAWVICDVRFKK